MSCWNLSYNVRIKVDCYNEVQTRISAVNNFVLPMLHEGALVLSSGETLADEFAF